MLRYTAKRILATIPVMLVVALFVFSLLYLSPGDPAAIIAGDTATLEEIAIIRESLGLDRPFLVRFGEWLGQVLQGDLGKSLYNDLPVTTLIAQRAEPTISLVILTVLISVMIAVPVGVLAAHFKGRLFDRAVMVIAVCGFSTPVFVVGYALAFLLAVKVNLFPVQGYVPYSEGFWLSIRSQILPALALSTGYIALISRITRTTMIEVLSQDYIRTARAKGLQDGPILFIHALKNASVPVITIVGIGIAALISGAVATETVFTIPGLGRLTVDAILHSDYPLIQGLVLLFSLSYVLINLLIDIIYSVFDPRIRY